MCEDDDRGGFVSSTFHSIFVARVSISEMYSVWESFVAHLQRVPSDAPFGEPADRYIHRLSGTVYENMGEIGNGRYGTVYAYQMASQDPTLPSEIAVKCIQRHAGDEMYAIHSMSAISATRPNARGFVHAAIIRVRRIRVLLQIQSITHPQQNDSSHHHRHPVDRQTLPCPCTLAICPSLRETAVIASRRTWCVRCR